MSRKPDYGLNCKVWHAPLGGRSPESNFKSPPTSPRNDTIADINRKIAGLERTKQHHQSVHAQNLEKKVQELEAQLRQRQQNRRSVQLRGGLADLTPEQEEAAVAERNKKLFYELLHLDPPTDSFASTSTSSSASRSISTNASPATRFQSPNPTNLKLDHRAFPSISALLKSPQKPNKQVPPSTTPAIKRNRSASVAVPAAAPLPLPMFKPVPRATSSEEVPELVNWRSKREEAWAKEQELKMREVEIAREKMRLKEARAQVQAQQARPQPYHLNAPQLKNALNAVLERDRPASVPPRPVNQQRSANGTGGMDQEAYRTLRELEMRLLEIEDLKRKRERDIIAAIQRKKSKSKQALVPQTPASHRKVHFDLSSSTPELSSASVSESEESSSLSEDYNEPDLSQAYDVLGANSAILAAQLRGEEPYYFDNQELLARYLSKSNLNKEELNRILAENGLDARSPLTPRPSIRTAPLTSLSARPTPQHRNSTTPQMSALHPSSTTPRMSQLTPRPSRVLQTPVIDSSLPSLTTDFVHLQEIRRRQTQSAHPTPRIRVRSNSTPHPVNRMPRRDGEEMLKQMLAEEKKDLESLEREQLEMQIKELERIEKERTANLIARMRGYEQLKRISTPKVPTRAQFHRTSNPW